MQLASDFLDNLIRPLFKYKKEYQDYKGLFLSKGYIEDKINFYPEIGENSLGNVITRKELEGVVEKKGSPIRK